MKARLVNQILKNKNYTLDQAIYDYTREIISLKRKKLKGITEVPARIYIRDWSGTDENETISIDKALELWEKDLNDLKSGKVNPIYYNY